MQGAGCRVQGVGGRVEGPSRSISARIGSDGAPATRRHQVTSHMPSGLEPHAINPEAERRKRSAVERRERQALTAILEMAVQAGWADLSS